MYYECRHILPSGAKCASPALRGQSFCYFHHTQRRPAASCPCAPHPDFRRASRRDRHHNPHQDPQLRLPLIEDAYSIQQSLNAVLQALAASRLQPRTASLLLYGLQVASSNLRALDSNLKYSSVRSAHTLPDGTLIGDNNLVTDLGDTPRELDRFEENHPAPQEPGEEPLDPDEEEYDEDSGDEEYEDDQEENDEEEDEDENGDPDEDPDEDEEEGDEDEEESDESDADDGDTGDDNENENGTHDEDEDSEEPEDGQREPADPASEPPQTGEIDYRQYIRQKLIEAFLPEAASIFEQGTATETSPNHDQTHAT